MYHLCSGLRTKSVLAGVSVRTLGAGLALEVHGLTQGVSILRVIADNQLFVSVEGTNFLLLKTNPES